jgi:hypothetical protein
MTLQIANREVGDVAVLGLMSGRIAGLPESFSVLAPPSCANPIGAQPTSEMRPGLWR